jgi:hypothetical protein
LDLTPLGAKVQEGTEEQQSWKEEEYQEVHEASLKGASNIPPFLQVEIKGSRHYYQVDSTQSQVQ